jgi:elongation factor 2
MPRFKQIAEIQQLMNRKENIRNMGIIAHIDHGKTTLADSLLAGAGLLSTQMAGSARVLDYLEEEQKRKITIKTANISLLYKSGADKYIINLVDTPGHVDFTGKVTRALRAIDGAVVVVDAVEEIMAQTEIVTRQALQERVRPVLFINKIDRLIVEMQLNAEQMEKKLNRIISSFNDLLELYGEEPFKEEWKIDASKGNVAFGSALHGWGFTLDLAQKNEVKFADVIDAYKNSEQMKLKKKIPVYDSIFDMAIKNLPSPKQAQGYRVDRIWDGARYSKTGKVIAECSDEGFAVMCVTNVEAIPAGGCVVTGRLFSGTIKEGDKLYRVNTQTETLVNKVYLYMGSFREEINQVSAGNIVALEVPDLLNVGETLVDEDHKAEMAPFEGINYVSEPVVTVVVEPKNPRDLPILLEAMNKLSLEDPNLTVSVNKESGEYLLSGMGELHLEITINQLKKIGGRLELAVSPPRVVYRESVTKKGVAAKALSPNRENRFTVQVEPEEEDQKNKLCVDYAVGALSVDEQRNVLVDCNEKTESTSEEVLEALIAGFEFACRAGPLCGEPMRHVKVNLIDLQLSEKLEQQDSTEIMHGMGKAVFGSFLTAKPVLLEPVYKTVITVSTDLAGECSRIIETRRGKISSFEQKGLLAVITGHVPVSETFGLSKEMRSATSGRAFWQNVFDCWQQVPEKLATKVITQVRKRKGLVLEVPSSKRFLEEE